MAALRLQYARQAAQKRGFTAAVAAHERMHATARDIQIDAAQHPRLAAVEAKMRIANANRRIGMRTYRRTHFPTGRKGRFCQFARRRSARRIQVDALRRIRLNIFRGMRRDDHGNAKLAIHAAQQEQELLHSIRIELRRGLVEQQHARTQRQHAGQVHDLLLASREVFSFLAHPWFNAKEVRNFGHTPAHFILRHADVFKPERKLMPYRVAYDLRGGVLHHEANRLRRFKRRKCLLALHAFPTCNTAQNACPAAICARRHKLGLQRAQERGFARTRRTHHDAKNALINAQVGPRNLKRGLAAVHRVCERKPTRFHGGRGIVFVRHSHDLHCNQSRSHNAGGTNMSSA